MTAGRTTALLAVILLALGLYVATIELPVMEEDAAQRTEAGRLLRFDYRDVSRVVYTTRTEHIVMRRDERGRWRILEPVAAKGDARRIESFLRALEIGRVSRVIQADGAAPEQYGLRPPRATIAVTADGQTGAIALGDVGPLSSTLYAQRLPDAAIVLTTLSVADFRKKTLHTFRLKDILPFDRTAVERIQLRTPRQRITLRRAGAFHGGAPRWVITSPVRAAADTAAVGVFLMTLDDLTATGFIDAQADKRALLDRLGSPRITAAVQTQRKRYRAAFFPPVSSGEDAYAVTSARAPVYRIPAGILTQLPGEVFHLQDKRLFGMESEEAALVTVTTAGWRYTLIQQHGVWHLEGEDADGIDRQRAALFVSRLAGLPAELPVRPTRDNLTRYALAPPAIDIVGIDKNGRRRGHLALGAQANGLVYAMGAGLPGVYQARSIILSQIPSPCALSGRATCRPRAAPP